MACGWPTSCAGCIPRPRSSSRPASTTSGSAVESLRQGVVDYLTKPFERDRLCEAVSRGVEWHRSACDSRRWREALEDEIHARRSHLEEVIASQFVDSDDDLDVLLATLMATTPDAYAHAYRVAALSAAVGRALGLGAAEITTLERAALLHDLGKLAMPEAVLRKPAPLTLEEQRLIRLHPRIGSELIEHVPYLARAAAVVRDVHERIDGLGYPSGRRGGRRVPVGADRRGRRRLRHHDRARASSAMRSPPAAAVAELERCSGTQFDPGVVAASSLTMAVIDRE